MAKPLAHTSVTIEPWFQALLALKQPKHATLYGHKWPCREYPQAVVDVLRGRIEGARK